MPRQETISNAFWDEVDDLSDDAVLLYVWSWTNPKCGMAGIYPISRRKIAEGRLSEDRLKAALAELEADGKLFYEDGVLWCTARVKRKKGIIEPIAKAILNDLEDAGSSHPLVQRFLDRYGDHPALAPLLKGHSTLKRPLAEGQGSGSESENGRPSPEGQPTLTRGSIQQQQPEQKQQQKNDQPPKEFPETLVPVAKRCVEVLQRVAVVKEAKPVTLLAVCRAIESYPNRNYVSVAGDLEHWCLHGNGARKPAKDVVSRWRNFLDGSPEVAQPSTNGTGEHKWAAYDAAIENPGGGT